MPQMSAVAMVDPGKSQSFRAGRRDSSTQAIRIHMSRKLDQKQKQDSVPCTDRGVTLQKATTFRSGSSHNPKFRTLSSLLNIWLELIYCLPRCVSRELAVK